MTPADICRSILGNAKLEAIVGELSSTQVKAVLKEGSVKAKVPGGYVSRQKRLGIWMSRITASLEENNDDLASELLQQWLLNHRRQLLIDFLDHLEVKHRQGETDESFLTSANKEKLLEAATWLLGRHDRLEARAYLLYIAYQQRSKIFDDWPELAA